MSKYPTAINTAVSIALEIGATLRKRQSGSVVLGHDAADHPDGKGHHAIHTAEDESAESFIRSRLRESFPLDSILGEENGLTLGTSGCTWVFDPIDGTSQYAAGMPADWCVAIGRWFGQEQELAVVYVPGTDELFYGARGRGVALGCGDAMSNPRTSAESDLKRSIFSVGVDMHHVPRYMRGRISPDGTVGPGEIERFSGATRTIRTVRSGDHELSLLAAGRINALYNWRQKPWDAIPLLLVEEAGGVWQRYDDTKEGFVALPNVVRPAADERVSYLAAGNETLLRAAREIIEQTYRR